VLSYRDLFQIYAEEAGLPRRIVLPLPGLTPRLCSYFIHLVTPVHESLARPLAEGLRNTVVCPDHAIRDIIPQDLMDVRRTIRRILVKKQLQIVETSWADAGAALPHEWVQTGDAGYAGPENDAPIRAIGRAAALPLAVSDEPASLVLWDRFWNLAEDPSEARQYGVRVAQCEAPGVAVEPGQVWEVTLDAAGGLNLKRLDVEPGHALDSATVRASG